MISARGLATCSRRRLLFTNSFQALEHCRAALVGHGDLEVQVLLPHQAPFAVHAKLLLFNARSPGGGRAILLQAYAGVPPTAAVVPISIRHRPGRFGTVLAADLPASIGPWPRFARVSLTLSRRYRWHGQMRSFISGSCPIPPRFTAGFLTLARATYTLEDGEELGTEIVRGCRAR